MNDSVVVGKGIDLDSVSFNHDNFCSSHESLQQKVKKMNQEQSRDFRALHKFPHC